MRNGYNGRNKDTGKGIKIKTERTETYGKTQNKMT
jgi:hypothetical protein